MENNEPKINSDASRNGEISSMNDKYGQQAYESACRFLKATPANCIIGGLKTNSLLLKHRCIGPTGAKALAAALMVNKTVETLDLEENGLEGEGVMYICEMLMENKTITTLNLAHNMLGSLGAMALANLIHNNNSIVNLDISYNELNDYDAEGLANAIEKNEKIINLNLSHNCFSPSTASLFSQAFGLDN